MSRAARAGVLVLAVAAALGALAWLAGHSGPDAGKAPAAQPAASQAPVERRTPAAAAQPPGVPVQPEAPLAAAPGKPPAPARRQAGGREASPQAEARPATGKAGADQATERKATHFRVGNRNIKRIFAEGDLIWVATSGGVIRYDAANDEYRLYDARSGLRGESALYVGRLGRRMAAGLYRGGLALFDEAAGRWEAIGTEEGLADGSVADALRAANGDVWIATAGGVNRVRGGEFRDRSRWDLYNSQATERGLPSDRAYGLAEGANGAIWVATEGGVARFQQGKWHAWRRAQGTAGESAATAAGGAHGAASDGARPANADFTVSIAVDRAGIVWAGTLGGGLSRFDGAQWRHYARAEGLPGEHVFALHADARGGLWIGTNNGLARMKRGKFEVTTTREGLFGDAVFAIASTPQALWVGGYGGVARLRGVN